MKPTLLILLATTAAASPTRPQPLPRANTPILYPHPNPHRLLHTFTRQAPSTRLLSASGAAAAAAAAEGDTILAGAVLTLSPSGDQQEGGSNAPLLSTVTGTFRIPRADLPTTGPTANNSATVYGASFWVGIDSGVSPSFAGCSASASTSSAFTAVLRAGVDIFYDGTLGGHQQPVAWFQGPGQTSETEFDGLVVAEGDLVRFTLEAVPKPKPAELANETAGKRQEKGEEETVVAIAENFGPDITCPEGATPIASVRQTLPATVDPSPSPSSSSSATTSATASTGASSASPAPTDTMGTTGTALCRTEAAWVIEDSPLANLPQVPIALVNFTSVAFAAGVTLDDGSVRELDGSGDGNGNAQGDKVEVLDITQAQQGGRLTKCEVGEGSEVTCVRVVGE